MKKFLSFFAFAVLAGATCLSLSACGGDDDKTDEPGETPRLDVTAP